ncbi:MAG: leucine-rich repeat domain-containing protein [bacterium]|nr:leucine-rich repeat domain-containing protein [bacterium]
MKIKWNVIGIMLIITAILIMQIPIPEADAASSASDFKMDGSTLISYTGTSTSVSVPSTVEVIGRSAFENNKSVTQISIPDSVEKIEPYAFWGCDKLEQVSLGGGLYEVSDFVFANCPSLKNIFFPDNINRIGIMAFADCASLRNIRIPYTVYDIDDTAFDGCYRLDIAYEPGTEGERFALYFAEKRKEMPEYEDIGEYGQIVATPTPVPEEQVIPTPLPDYGISGTELGSTHVVGNMAVVFMDNTLPNVNSGAQREQSGTDRETSGEPLMEYTTEKEKGTVRYTLVDGRILADRAYYGYQNLGSIDLPESMEEIGEFSFARSSLQTVMIPEGVTSIGYGAFYHCDRLAEVSLPSTINHIGPKAFTYTRWVEQFYEDASNGQDFLIAGDGILIAYKGDAAQIEVPEGIRQIGPEVFQGHSEIMSVSLPESLEIIGEAAFAECNGLTEVSGMSHVKIIRDRAFYHCPLEWVVLPDTVESVGLGAFARESVGGAVLLQGQLPCLGEEPSAGRRSNEGYRCGAFDGVEYVLIGRDIIEQELGGTVLGSELTVYKGIIGYLDSNILAAECTYLTDEELLGRMWTERVTIDGMSYQVQGLEQLRHLTPQWQPSRQEGMIIAGNVELQALLEPQGDGAMLQARRLDGIIEAPELDAAYRRIYQQGLPMDAVCFSLRLCEGESGVAITRLGRQELEVTMPLPAQLQGQELRLVTLDRNGQLEYLPLATDGKQISFSTDYLSIYALYGSGTLFAQGDVVEGQVVITSYGRRDASPDTGDFIHPKWILGMGLLMAGLAILLLQRRNRAALPD